MNKGYQEEIDSMEERQIGFDLNAEAEYAEDRTRCPKCGSDDIGSFGGDFATGVVAPDGGREFRYEEGFECQQCGFRFDEKL